MTETCSAADIKKYRKLLLDVGVPIEIPRKYEPYPHSRERSIAFPKAPQIVCSCLTDPGSRNLQVRDHADMRNLVAQGFFTSKEADLLILPPDKDIFQKVSNALFAEAMRSSGLKKKIVCETMWNLHGVYKERFGSDVKYGGNQRVLASPGTSTREALLLPPDYFKQSRYENDKKVSQDGKAVAAWSVDHGTTGIVHLFEHEGVFYTMTGGAGGGDGTPNSYSSLSVHRMIPRSEWKKKVLTYQERMRQWDKNEASRGDMTGVGVKARGKPYVFAQSFIAVPDVPEMRWED